MNLCSRSELRVRETSERTKFGRIGFAFFALLCLSSVEFAQNQVQPVQWTGSTLAPIRIRQGSKFSVELTAKIEDGWHVYGLEQVSGGPTPLRVTLEENDIVQNVGLISGSTPVKKHDSSFDLDTQFYSQSFTLRLPVQVKPHSSIGNQVVLVAVRFQACNDRTCLPPRTVHVSVPFELVEGR